MSNIPQARLDQLRAMLVDGIPRFERRRRRVRLVQAAASIGLVGALATAVAASQDTPDGTEGRVATGDVTGDGPRCPAGDSGFTVESLSARGVPAVLLASDINAEAVVVSDLDRGCRAVYPGDAHTLGQLLAAAFTSNDQLIAAAFGGPPLVYPAGRTASGQHVLVDGGLAQPGDPLPDGPSGDLFPTDSGDAVWFMPDTTELDGDKPLGFVDLGTGETREVTVPAGSLLVDVDGDNAILHPAAIKAAGAGTVIELEPGYDMLAVAPSGETTTLEAPEPASFVTRTQGQTIWIAGDIRFRDASCPCGDRVLVVADDGTTTAIPLPDNEGSQLRDPGPRSLGSPSLRTVTSDGTRLLLQLTDPSQPESTPTRLVVVDLEAGTMDVFPVAGTAAFWASDDRTAILVNEGVRPDGDGPGTAANSVIAVDTVTGATTTIDNALPDDFRLIAAQ